MSHKLTLSVLLVCLLVSYGCTWVKLSPDGSMVSIASENDIADCRKLGAVTVSLLAKVAGIERNSAKVARELATLGRNAAAEMGGDTAVAVSAVSNGEQTFDVYVCNDQK